MDGLLGGEEVENEFDDDAEQYLDDGGNDDGAGDMIGLMMMEMTRNRLMIVRIIGNRLMIIVMIGLMMVGMIGNRLMMLVMIGLMMMVMIII